MEPITTANNNFTELLFDALSYKKRQYRKAENLKFPLFAGMRLDEGEDIQFSISAWSVCLLSLEPFIPSSN